MIKAEVVADSRNVSGDRITTMVVTFPRIILAEFNTHRMFSRNSASSRAIPFNKMMESVSVNPFVPIAWQRDHKGMQGIEYMNEKESERLVHEWLSARREAVMRASFMSGFGSTKQLCNRLLEPFMWHTVIVTATEWENFFALRCPRYEVPFTFDEETKVFRSKRDVFIHLENARRADKKNPSLGTGFLPTDEDWRKFNKGQAEIHMMALAEAMWDAYNESTPRLLDNEGWHIPFGDKINGDLLLDLIDPDGKFSDDVDYTNKLLNDALIKIATARCARVSYTVVGEEDKPDNYENDFKLHDRLSASGHWSPFEHCAKSMKSLSASELTAMVSNHEEVPNNWSGNFKGFVQYRKMFQNENIK